jgi:NDP-sugar pyrophosphorylase family protein
MRAIILAGGKGARLRPYTTLIPKPLVPLGGRYSILEIVIIQLVRHGFTSITMAVNHLSNLIMAYFGDGSRWNIRIDYSREEGELGTIGPLTLINDLPENFLVMNGDILTDLDYGRFLRAHTTENKRISVAAYKRQQKVDFGVLQYDDQQHLTGFQEKPILPFNVSMGIYCMNRKVVEALPRGKAYGFDNLMKDSLAGGSSVSICPFDGFWLDIGRPDDYEYADEHFSEIASKLGVEL